MEAVSDMGRFGGENRKWWTLAAVSFGLFMIMLDNTVVNVALPSIQHDLGLALSELEWVVAGYALTFAAFMLTGGKLADLLGRRLIFVVGLASSPPRRSPAGSPPAPVPDRRARRAGRRRRADEPGDALDHHRHVPAAAARHGDRHLGRRLRARARDRAARRRAPLRARQLELDLLHQRPRRCDRRSSPRTCSSTRRRTPRTGSGPTCQGSLTSAIGLFALTYGLIEANSYGWGSTRILGAFASPPSRSCCSSCWSSPSGCRCSTSRLFRNPTFSGANVAMLFIALAMFGVFFYVSLYIQQILGYSPVEAGASFLPATLLIAFLAPIVGKQSDRIGSRWLTGAGMLLAAVSLLIFSRLDTGSSYWDILPGLLFLGVGMALTMTPTTAAAMSSVPRDQAGVGSAVLNSMRQVGGSLGIAVTGAIVAHVSAGSLAEGHTRPVAFVDGFQVGLEVAAAIAVAGAVIAVATMRSHSERRPDEVPLEEPALQEAA